MVLPPHSPNGKQSACMLIAVCTDCFFFLFQTLKDFRAGNSQPHVIFIEPPGHHQQVQTGVWQHGFNACHSFTTPRKCGTIVKSEDIQNEYPPHEKQEGEKHDSEK